MQIVTTHKNADFDAVASLMAATLLYPGVVPVVPKTVNPNVRAFLSIHKDIFEVHNPGEIDPEAVERLIVVDTGSWNRLDGMEALRRKEGLDIVLWDHHAGSPDILSGWKCHEEMGANISLMIRALRSERKLITPMQATLFLAGLYEDTGNLTFSSTRADDAYAAGYLLERKADLSIIGSLLRPAYGEKQKNVLFELLKAAPRDRINGHTVSINTLSLEGHVGSLSVVVSMYREILNVDAAFGIFSGEDNGRCMVIGRSGVEAIDVGSIMKSMGGGGHPGAGSAILKSVNPQAVETWIRELIQGNQQASVQVSDLMSFPVVGVDSDTSMEDVAVLLRKKGCTGLPVTEDDRLVGVISRRDFKKAKKKAQMKLPVKAFMSTRVVTIEPGKNPTQAARLLIKHDIGRLPVVEDGKIIGIITRSDVMRYYYDLLPD